MLIRLNKFLSDSGVCSRREADEHILAGEVKINESIAKLGEKIDPDTDRVYFNEKLIKPRTEKFVYYALYKPKGIVSTSSDEKGRQSVVDLVPKTPRVYPVGRLDQYSEGLIILTDDGAFANELMHPSHEYEKEYEVKVSGIQNQSLGIKQIENKLISGLEIDGKLMRANDAAISKIHNTQYIIRIVLRTGYNRQIRKMCAKLGLGVSNLKRIRIGKLRLESMNLKAGEYKKISRNDVF